MFTNDDDITAHNGSSARGAGDQDGREPLRLLTVEQACQRLQVSRAVLYGLLNSGQLRSFHIGRSRRIPVEALDELVARSLGDDGAA